MANTRLERDAVARAWECIKKHPEIGRVYKKDLVPLESFGDNGLVRAVTVMDRFSKRVFFCGQSERLGTYNAVIETTES